MLIVSPVEKSHLVTTDQYALIDKMVDIRYPVSVAMCLARAATANDADAAVSATPRINYALCTICGYVDGGLTSE